ncbi:anthranilate phosphoribosyltransferase [Bacillus sp. MRMR6]|uniref:anthranilate phosphoribosyltransferase n=1 Tax=Bacillus sp. MRMR6 TaxID=1928617 RepID=UPI00095135F9|nr:glycosyl transferase [Bacillus sp. MRMR6]OLS40391.1 glycosyl transferase [Bacillus sp. MRMR6]
MQQWIKEVARGKRGSKDLDYDQTREVARLILSGEATDAQVAAYFIAQRLKTESPEELLAFTHALQEASEKLRLSNRNVIDLASPYNGRNSLTGTIPTALLLAEKGQSVFLHGSDPLPPKYGTALKDILVELGIEVTLSASQLTNIIEETRIGFASTEQYCPGLSRLRQVRIELGVRTLLNTVEKLLDLSQANSLMMGAYHRTAINKIAPIFKGLSYKNVYIVQGMEGSEDLPVHRNSFIYRISGDEMESMIVKPEEFGLLEEEFDKNIKLTANEQAEIILALLSGEKTGAIRYYYHQVVFNTGIRYYLFGVAASIEEGIEMAKEQLSNQDGLRSLEKWKAIQQPSLLK